MTKKIIKKSSKLELFALTINGEFLNPKTFKKYWPNYGANQLHGWRFPKKIYFTMGTAKCGLSYVPVEIRDKVKITSFSPTKELKFIHVDEM